MEYFEFGNYFLHCPWLSSHYWHKSQQQNATSLSYRGELLAWEEFNSFILCFNSATFNGFAVLQIKEAVSLVSKLKSAHAFFKT